MNKSKTVMYVVMTDLARNNGAISRARHLIDLLMEEGASVTLVGLSPDPRSLSYPCRVICVKGNMTLVSMLRTAIAAVIEGFRGRYRLAVLSTFGNAFNPFLAAALRLFGTRVAYDCQDEPVETVHTMYGSSFRGRLLTDFVGKTQALLGKCVNDVLSVSDGVTEIHRRRGWTSRFLPFRNIHSGLRKPKGAVASEDVRERFGWHGATIVVYVGALVPNTRGIEDQLRAVAEARRRGANVAFLARGFGADEYFNGVARDLGIGDYASFGPPVAHEQLYGMLSQADCAVMSFSIPYALPTKLFDFLASGVRVLCNTSNLDIIRVCGEYVTPFDGSVDALATLLIEHPVRNDLQRVGRLMEKLHEENRQSIRDVLAAS